MLHIILLILKIIGIILLCILGLLLFVILSVLFIPVRYRMEVTREEGEDKPPVLVYAKITWFLHLFNILLAYPGDVLLRVRIMLFTIFRIPQKKKKKKKKKAANKKKEPVESRENTEHSTRAEVKNDPPPVLAIEAKEPDIVPESTSNTKILSSFIAKMKEIADKIKGIAIKIREFCKNIRYTIRKIYDRIRFALDNIQYYREVLESESFQKSLRLCKKELSSLARGLKPDKFETDLVIGLENPAALGEILAVWGIFYPLIGQHVQIVGDFECARTRIEGSMYMKGKIRMFTFLRIALHIYFSQDIKILIKQLKKEAA